MPADSLKSAIEHIEAAEAKIESQETKILAAEKKILNSVKDRPVEVFNIDPGLTKREVHLFRTALVGKLARHKIIFSLLIATGVVLVWRGLWATADIIPILNNALVSLLAGIIILWILKKYTDLH